MSSSVIEVGRTSVRVGLVAESVRLHGRLGVAVTTSKVGLHKALLVHVLPDTADATIRLDAVLCISFECQILPCEPRTGDDEGVCSVAGKRLQLHGFTFRSEMRVVRQTRQLARTLVHATPAMVPCSIGNFILVRG